MISKITNFGLKKRNVIHDCLLYVISFSLPIILILLNLFAPRNFILEIYVNDQKLFPYPFCQLCSMKPVDRNVTANSTPRDVILSISFGKIMSIFPFVRAMRTSGCRARMIVFVDRAAKKKYSSMFYQKLQDCGVELIKPRIRVNYNDPTFQRYEVFLDYLLKHRKEIDRVITIDLFDTCLQYDPFTTEFRKDQFFLQPEGAKIGSDPYNRAWINCSFNTYKALGANSVSDVNIAEIGTKEIVNGGEQAGGVEEMIKFLRMILKTKNKCQDQGFINFYYYSGLMEKQFNIKVTPLPHGNNLFSAVGILAYKREYTVPRTLTLGEVKVDGKLPALIHQFDRCKSFATLITDACPNTDPPFPDYIRC